MTWRRLRNRIAEAELDPLDLALKAWLVCSLVLGAYDVGQLLAQAALAVLNLVLGHLGDAFRWAQAGALTWALWRSARRGGR